MLIERIEMNIEELKKEELIRRHIEKVYLESDHLVKRVQRVKTDHGREVGSA